MPNPKLIEETPLSLAEVKESLKKIEEDDKELNYLSNKTKEYLQHFVTISNEKKEELYKKLVDLNLIRLKEVHIAKIMDFLPTTADDLKIVLQAYPVTMPKKDITAILAIVKEFA